MELGTVAAVARALHQLDRLGRRAEREAVVDALYALRRLCWAGPTALPPRLRADRNAVLAELRELRRSA